MSREHLKRDMRPGGGWRRALGAVAALGLLVVQGCAAREVRPEPVAAPSRPTLQQAVSQLAAEAALLSPGSDVAIAVRNLRTGEYAGVADEVPHVSASAAKVLWVAAALARVGTDKVAPHAEPIFRTSDNLASGQVIDLIGPDAVNDWYRELGLKHTALTRWRYGNPKRVATNSPRELGDDNYFTARDMVDVLSRMDRGELLGGPETQALRQWMTLTPRTGCGGWMGALLPQAAQATLLHKAGWLPPGCCSDDATYNTLTEVGVVQVPGGERYAVALLARRGSDYWRRQAPFIERASCVLYRTVSQDATLSCHEVGGVLEPASFGLPESAPVPQDCD